MKLKRKFGLIFYALPIIFLIILLVLEIGHARKEVSSEGVAYREESKISPRVLLKQNDMPFGEPYLDNTLMPIASLIDKFVVNYNYINTFSTDVNYKIKYNVVADLMVYDSNNNSKPIYTKQYTLVNDREISGNGIIAKIDLLNENINYNEYTALVNQFKKEVIPEANLIVKFNTIFEGTTDKLADTIKSSKTSTLIIPITQKTIKVEIKNNPSKQEEYVSGSKKLKPITLFTIIATVVLLIIFIIKYILYMLKTAKKKSKYDVAVSKILREFDRAITEASGKLKIDKNANTIEVKDFMELLDVHDNFNIPIIYYKVSRYMSVFLVKNDNDIYYSIMKSDDYE